MEEAIRYYRLAAEQGHQKAVAKLEKLSDEADAGSEEPIATPTEVPTAGTSEVNSESTGYEVGDIVRFGSYNQDNDMGNGAEPIEWQVLEVRDDGSYVLLSVYGLEAKQYNRKGVDVTWETCSLRVWLNVEFYRKAFTAEERARIVTVTNRNADNPSYDTTGGNDTEDRVWLLSLDDVCRYYEGISPEKDKGDAGCKEQLIAKPTMPAVAHGASTLSQETVDMYQSDYGYPLQAGAGWWWLRSPGSDSRSAAYVGSYGSVYTIGDLVRYGDAMVRPVVVVAPGLFN